MGARGVAKDLINYGNRGLYYVVHLADRVQHNPSVRAAIRQLGTLLLKAFSFLFWFAVWQSVLFALGGYIHLVATKPFLGDRVAMKALHGANYVPQDLAELKHELRIIGRTILVTLVALKGASMLGPVIVAMEIAGEYYLLGGPRMWVSRQNEAKGSAE